MAHVERLGYPCQVAARATRPSLSLVLTRATPGKSPCFPPLCSEDEISPLPVYRENATRDAIPEHTPMIHDVPCGLTVRLHGKDARAGERKADDLDPSRHEQSCGWVGPALAASADSEQGRAEHGASVGTAALFNMESNRLKTTSLARVRDPFKATLTTQLAAQMLAELDERPEFGIGLASYSMRGRTIERGRSAAQDVTAALSRRFRERTDASHSSLTSSTTGLPGSRAGVRRSLGPRCRLSSCSSSTRGLRPFHHRRSLRPARTQRSIARPRRHCHDHRRAAAPPSRPPPIPIELRGGTHLYSRSVPT